VKASAEARPGIYGKLPSRGDFVTRRLPTTFVDPWDQWLQESLADSRDQLGERWLDTYLTSPVWRFLLSPGVAGPLAWAGVLMPSVDRVGRYFPLTLGCPLSGASNPIGAMTDAGAWYDAAEALVLACLEDPFDLDSFDRQLIELGPPPTTLQRGALRRGPWDARRMPLPGDLKDACPELLSQTLAELFLAFSLWWSQGSQLVQPSLLLCQGLPPTQGFSAMMAAEWERWGWNQTASLCSADEASSRAPQ